MSKEISDTAQTARPPHGTSISRAKWERPGELQRDSCAWWDEATNKGRFPHHDADGAANVTACLQGIASLNNANGKVPISDAERAAVWRHLAAHLTDAGEEPPELRRTEAETMERRTFDLDKLEIRQDGDGPPMLRGYVARFGELSDDLGGFREKIARGAFNKTVGESDIRFLLNHDPNIVLGRNVAGTLELRERTAGLYIENKLPDTQQARDLKVSVERGDITQGSFGFRTIRDKWDEDHENDTLTRTLQEVKLFDVSVVTFPAYPKTKIQARVGPVAEILAKADSGQELTPVELRSLSTHLTDVQQYLPEEPPEGDGHSEGGEEDTPAWRSRLRSRWMELAAK